MSLNKNLPLAASHFRRHLSSALFFNKLSFGKMFIHVCKVERLNVKQRSCRSDVSLSRLIWIYVVCKSLILLPVAAKELNKIKSYFL